MFSSPFWNRVTSLCCAGGRTLGGHCPVSWHVIHARLTIGLRNIIFSSDDPLFFCDLTPGIGTRLSDCASPSTHGINSSINRQHTVFPKDSRGHRGWDGMGNVLYTTVARDSGVTSRRCHLGIPVPGGRRTLLQNTGRTETAGMVHFGSMTLGFRWLSTSPFFPPFPTERWKNAGINCPDPLSLPTFSVGQVVQILDIALV